MITLKNLETRKDREISGTSIMQDINIRASKIGRIRFKYSNIAVMLAARAAQRNKQGQLHALSVAMWSLAKAIHGHVLTCQEGIKYVN